MVTTEHPSVQTLYRVEGEAEIIDGRIVHLPMTGDEPGYAGDAIFVSLHQHVRATRRGRAVGDGKGFLTDLPRRHFFSPHAAFYTGPAAGMKFYPQAPDFAVEVRSVGDYGPAAEPEMMAKRVDYFAAGTLVVWDVDLLSERVVCVYCDGNADQPAATFRRGDTADAEPAVPGWTMVVDDLFAPAA